MVYSNTDYPTPRISDSVDLRPGLIICISNKFPGDANTIGYGPIALAKKGLLFTEGYSSAKGRKGANKRIEVSNVTILCHQLITIPRNVLGLRS